MGHVDKEIWGQFEEVKLICLRREAAGCYSEYSLLLNTVYSNTSRYLFEIFTEVENQQYSASRG